MEYKTDSELKTEISSAKAIKHAIIAVVSSIIVAALVAVCVAATCCGCAPRGKQALLDRFEGLSQALPGCVERTSFVTDKETGVKYLVICYNKGAFAIRLDEPVKTNDPGERGTPAMINYTGVPVKEGN